MTAKGVLLSALYSRKSHCYIQFSGRREVELIPGEGPLTCLPVGDELPYKVSHRLQHVVAVQQVSRHMWQSNKAVVGDVSNEPIESIRDCWK